MKFILTLIALASPLLPLCAQTDDKPNIVFLFCDDLGYGDVQILNPDRGKIKTPHLDALARSGMIFTDAHSGSAVCTPTRYGLLTGRYSWRTNLQRGVVQGFGPNLVAADRPTVATFLKAQGYHTALFGKWHLNFRYTDPETGKELTKKGLKRGLVPVGTTIPDSPLTRGFDRFHGIHHAGSMKAIIEGDTVIKHEDEINFLPRLTRESIAYVNERGQDKGTPFFLYLPYGSPHTPIVPSKEWQGKSGINNYADFVMENDDSVGQVIQALKDNGLYENTLIIFTADNGCSKAANFKQLEAKGHFASAHMRGSKADLWDGGHRVPFLASWPGHVEPGTTNDTTLCLTDLFATCVDILQREIPAGSCEDSVSFLPAFKNEALVSTRKGIIHHSIDGHFAYRLNDDSGQWKLLLAYGSGGWTAPKEEAAQKQKLPKAQLYNLAEDPAETNNLYESNPEKAKALLDQLTTYIHSGRSTEGPESSNDLPNEKIILWKSE